MKMLKDRSLTHDSASRGNAMKRTGVVVCLLLLLAVPLLAQVNTADIVGRVLDPNGLAVPGAKVTVQSEATGQTRETTTNDSGEFVVALLPAGNYKVTVEKSGFSTKVYEKLVLAVGSKQDLEVSLALGAVTVITVPAAADPDGDSLAYSWSASNGSISGAVALGSNGARAAGPVGASLLVLALGGYEAVFWTFAAALVLVGLVVLATPAHAPAGDGE